MTDKIASWYGLANIVVLLSFLIATLLISWEAFISLPERLSASTWGSLQISIQDLAALGLYAFFCRLVFMVLKFIYQRHSGAINYGYK